METSLEFDPDTSELAPDLTEYTIKLKVSESDEVYVWCSAISREF
jgi:hypothetical protein